MEPRADPKEVQDQLAAPHLIGGGILNALVQDVCPAGAGMYYATEEPCGGCILVDACVEMHRQRLARARAGSIMGLARQFEKVRAERSAR